jgi:7-carboxy-7-deazaguanine synthase
MMHYPVMERFKTLQGEGAFTGVSAWFIRLGGCDVGCAWCDVKESWEASAHPQVSVDALVDEALAAQTAIVVVTGGEPLMHDCGPLTSAIRAAGLKVHLETSGAHPFTGDWDWVTLSPKRFKAAQSEAFERADELKVVVVNRQDYAWAEEHATRLRPEAVRYLQPEWDRRDRLHEGLVEYIASHPSWRLSLQTHKYLEIR